RVLSRTIYELSLRLPHQDPRPPQTTPLQHLANVGESDDENSMSEDGDGDADEAKRKSNSMAQSSYEDGSETEEDEETDDDDNDNDKKSKKSKSAKRSGEDNSDAEADAAQANGGPSASHKPVSARRRADIRERVSELQTALQEASRVVTAFRSDKTGRWVEVDLQFDSKAGKLLLINVVERTCRMSVVHAIPGIQRVTIQPPQPGTTVSNTLAAEGIASGDFGEGVIDFDKLYTNDIGALLHTYGVEAARAAIVSEMKAIFDTYDIAVSMQHLYLIADYQTATGGFRPFNCSGIADAPSPPPQGELRGDDDVLGQRGTASRDGGFLFSICKPDTSTHHLVHILELRPWLGTSVAVRFFSFLFNFALEIGIFYTIISGRMAVLRQALQLLSTRPRMTEQSCRNLHSAKVYLNPHLQTMHAHRDPHVDPLRPYTARTSRFYKTNVRPSLIELLYLWP
ncbi:hypothetical protein CF328_g3309, partial [Tilletia controversa]